MFDKSKDFGFNPDYAVPPGFTLKEVLEDRGMTQKELSKRTGISEKQISNIIKGNAPISPTTASELEKVLNISTRFWVNLEANYQAVLVSIKSRKAMESQSKYLDKYPYNELSNHGWVEKTRDKVKRVSELLSFFEVSSLDKIKIIQDVAYRKAKNRNTSAEALSAWLQKGTKDSQNIDTKPYDKLKFIETLRKVRKITSDLPKNFGEVIREMCRLCGVAVVFVPHLNKTYVNGASRWLTTDKAIIQLSLRYRYEDIFWFTFFHEAAHIIKHGKTEYFIDCDKDILSDKEQEANNFAANFLIPQLAYNVFINAGNYSIRSIKSFAKRLGIAPAIVVGRLAHDKIISYNYSYISLRKKFDWSES